MKHLLYLLALSAFICSCAHIPQFDADASREALISVKREMEELHRQSLRHLQDGEISRAVHLLVSALAKANSVEKAADEILASTSYRRIEATLRDVQLRMTIAPGRDWREKQPGQFVPANEGTSEPPMPRFYLQYRHNNGDVPVQGVSYSLRYSSHKGTSDSRGKTGALGRGECEVEKLKGLRESESESVVELVCSYETSGFAYTFDKLRALYFYPPQKILVEVKNGERVRDLLDRLVAKGLTTPEAFLQVAQETDYPDFALVPPPRAHINRFEGLFKPGQYSFARFGIRMLEPELKDDEKGVDLNRAVAIDNAEKIIRWLIKESIWSLDAPQNGLKAYDQLILASIVEKEAVANRDYEQVASVFYNRLKMGSQLASCPAVEYALGYHRPFLKREDILIDSPYNLYLRDGLPPTPICFFSEEALKAVKKPVKSNLLYFVYDWTSNRLNFAAGYQEHLDNARKARLNYAKMYGADALYEIRYDKYYEE